MSKHQICAWSRETPILSSPDHGSRPPFAVAEACPTLPGCQTLLQFFLLPDVVQWRVALGGDRQQSSQRWSSTDSAEKLELSGTCVWIWPEPLGRSRIVKEIGFLPAGRGKVRKRRKDQGHNRDHLVPVMSQLLLFLFCLFLTNQVPLFDWGPQDHQPPHPIPSPGGQCGNTGGSPAQGSGVLQGVIVTWEGFPWC